MLLYLIKVDLRKLKNPMTKLTFAQQALHQGLITLLNTKKINQVSIKELTQTSNVARSTFYAYYDNIDNLLEEIEDTFIENLNTLDQSITDSATNNFTYFYEVLNYVEENSKLLSALLIKDYDYRLVKKWKTAIKANLYRRFKLTNHNIKAELLFEMTASEVISADIFYLKHKAEVDRKFILDLISKELTNLATYF